MTTRHSENWEYYPAEIDGHVASVRVDMNIEKPFAYSYLLQVPFAAYPNGLILESDIERIDTIEDSVHELILKEKLDLKHVGTIISNAHADYYFSSQELLDFTSIIKKHMQEFPNDAFHTEAIQFDVYATLLYPNSIDQATILNRDMVMDLEKKGDMLTESRVTTYLFEFQNDKSRDDFNKLLPRSINVQQTDDSFTLALNMDLIPTFANLNECSYYLIQAATPFGGRLKGIEMSPVIQ